MQIVNIQQDMPTTWPKNLNLQDQGRFAIGYYHQRFTRKGKNQADTDDNNDQTLEN